MSYPPNPGNWNQGPTQPPQQPIPPQQQFPQGQQYPQAEPAQSQSQPMHPQQYSQPQQPNAYPQQYAQPQQPYYPPRATQVGAQSKPKKGPLRAIVAIVITVLSAGFFYTAINSGLGSINLLSSSPFGQMPKWVGVGLLAIVGCVVGFVIAVLSFLKRRPKIIASVAVGLAVVLPFLAFFFGFQSGTGQVQEHVTEVAEMGPEVLDDLIKQLEAEGHDVTIIETIRDELERRGVIESPDS